MGVSLLVVVLSCCKAKSDQSQCSRRSEDGNCLDEAQNRVIDRYSKGKIYVRV